MTSTRSTSYYDIPFSELESLYIKMANIEEYLIKHNYIFNQNDVHISNSANDITAICNRFPNADWQFFNLWKNSAIRLENELSCRIIDNILQRGLHDLDLRVYRNKQKPATRHASRLIK